MAKLVYVLCLITSLGCAGMLYHSFRNGGSKLLLWCAMCFLGLAMNNLILFLDFFVILNIDLSPYRNFFGVLATTLMVWGLVSEVA